jgi:lysophospholipase L1-like esterase/nicotinamidase-related amidase
MRISPLKLILGLIAGIGTHTNTFSQEMFSLDLRTRSRSGTAQIKHEAWFPAQTALIVCDMWDTHPCKNAALRSREMAHRMNALLTKARSAGALIIHAPSSCMAAYAETPARKRAQAAPPSLFLPTGIDHWCRQIPTEEATIYPLDQSDGGSDDEPEAHEAWGRELEKEGRDPKAPWLRQIETLQIVQEKDAVSDSGSEIWNLLDSRGVRNVILVGVHTNMCVAGRPFGLRQMAKNGKHVVLMRDLTDTMYNPLQWPYVSHFRGTELFLQHVEKHICPTVTSDQFLGGLPFSFSAATAGPPRIQILLLGDSTTEASLPKRLAPDEPQFEDGIRIRLASDKDLPPCDVHNLGLSGEFIRRLLDSGRYDKVVATAPSADFIFIRYGINDRSKRDDFETNFPKDYRELIGRLRTDHPKATIIPTSIIPYTSRTDNSRVNNLVRTIAETEMLPFFDIHPRYAAELSKGENMLNYRRLDLTKVPTFLHPIVKPYVQPGPKPEVVVMDNRLDGHLGDVPGWFSDRHPNQAGYQVIADETSKFLAPLVRKRAGLQ